MSVTHRNSGTVVYQRVIYGSGDDAILTELFGIETPYSVEAEKLRSRLGALEGKVLRGQGSPEEIAEYEMLSERLTSSLNARVDQVASQGYGQSSSCCS